MSRNAFDKIADGLNEALAIVRGTEPPAGLFIPPDLDVRAIRARTNMPQEQFAAAFGFSVHQVRQWEQGRHKPLGAMRAYLMVIAQKHDEVLSLLREASNSVRPT